MQQPTKLKKRREVKSNLELKALNSMRMCEPLYEAVSAYIPSPHLSEVERNQLRAVLAVLSQAPLTLKLLASL